MVVSLSEGFHGITREQSEDIEGYLGTWVTVLYVSISLKNHTYTGRFVGWSSEGSTKLIFENYVIQVYPGKKFSMYGLNESKDDT